MNRCLLLYLVVLLPTILYAQEQTARFEREHKNSDSDYIIISLQKEGLAMVRDKDKYKEGKQQWEVVRVDTTLQEVWLTELEIENRLRLVGYDYRDNLIYLLYREGDHEASNLVLYTIHTQSQAIGKYTIKQEITFKVTHFSALANVVTLGGYVSNEPAILLFDLQTEKAKLVPGFFITNSELLDLRVNTNNTFNALIMDRSNKQDKKLLLKTFDATGAVLLEDVMEIENERTILSGLTSTLINDELLIAGTWTMGNSKQASGIFTSLINPFDNQEINFYDFGRFNHFVDYLSKKRAAKIKLRAVEAAKIGKVPDFKTYAVPLRLEEQPEGFGLLLEVYQPSTNFSPYPYGNFGPPMYAYSPYGYNPFMSRYYNTPYQYNQPAAADSKMIYASLAILDINGNPLRDFGMKLGELKTNTLEQTSDFIFYKGKMAMGFKKEKEVRLLRSFGDEVELDTVQSIVLNPAETVRHESETASYIRSWYNNAFYVWGYQTLRHSSQSSLEAGRQVFYINKIEIK